MFVTSSAIKRRKIVSVWHICSWNGSSGLELSATKLIFGTTITHAFRTLLFVRGFVIVGCLDARLFPSSSYCRIKCREQKRLTYCDGTQSPRPASSTTRNGCSLNTIETIQNY